MGFFDPAPAPPPPPPRPPQPPWMGPPEGVLGGFAPVRAVLIKSDSLLIVVDGFVVYPTGFEFVLTTVQREAEEPLHPMFLHGRTGAGQAELLRFGVAFADGRKATNLGPAGPLGARALDAGAMVLMPRGGGGGGGRWRQEWWVFGLPPDGPVTFVVEWPTRQLPETHAQVDGTALRRAADQAEVLWEVDSRAVGSGGHGAWVASGGAHAMRVDATDSAVDELVTTGPPPEDEEAARRDIEAVFSAIDARAPDEPDTLVNVQRGEHLGPTLDAVLQLNARYVGQTQQTVDHIAFLNAREAAVRYSVWLGGSPLLSHRRGFAVLVDGRWKVSRETFCEQMSLGGIPCPPALDP